MKRLALLSLVFSLRAFAAYYCGGQAHQSVCGWTTNIYPCCDNGSNCTWWAWESMCRNWGFAPGNWGNARTWGGNARLDPRFEVVGPTSGAVATSNISYYGHVAWSVSSNGSSATVTEQACCPTCSGSTWSRYYSNANYFNTGYVIRAGSQCECSPGGTDKRACGSCGQQTRSCGGNCKWGGWSACGGPDPEGGNQVCANGAQGVCADARNRCEGGNLYCRSLTAPSAETCDGLDNDCDGSTDEDHPATVAADYPWAAQRVDASAPRGAPAGSAQTVWVEFKNVGARTWERGDVYLRAKGGDDGVSPLRAESWNSYQLAAGTPNPVAKNETGRFTFEVVIPKTPGVHVKEHFELEGLGSPVVCPDGELDVDILVLNEDGTEAPPPDAGAGVPGGSMKLSSESGCSSSPTLLGAVLVLALLLRVRVRHAAPRRVLRTPELTSRERLLVLTAPSMVAAFSASRRCASLCSERLAAHTPTLADTTLRAAFSASRRCASACSERLATALAASVLGAVSRQRPRLLPAGAAALVLLIAPACGDAQLTTANETLYLSYTEPRIVSARGGETLVVHGAGFTEDAKVSIGGHPVRTEVLSETELRVRTPPLVAGRAAVSVSAPKQPDATLHDGLEVLALTLRFVEAPPHALAPPAGTVDSAALADFDGDDDLDLVTCGATCDAWLNDANANFEQPADAGAMPAARLLLLRDLNGDTLPDAVFSSGGLYLNDVGVFPAEPALTFPGLEAVALIDLEQDGTQELLTAAAGLLRVEPLIFTKELVVDAGEVDAGSGAVDADAGVVDAGPQPLLIPEARALVVADFDGDGDDDVVLSTAAAPNGIALRLFLNKRGVLTEVPGGLPGSPVQVVKALAAGDLDGDGAIDLLAVGEGQDRVLLNDGSAHFFDATPALLPVDNSPGTSVALVDLDKDRDLDAVIGNSTGAARLYLNQGNGRFVDDTPLLPVASRNLAAVMTGDLDSDGDDDLVLVGASLPDSRIYLSVEPRP